MERQKNHKFNNGTGYFVGYMTAMIQISLKYAGISKKMMPHGIHLAMETSDSTCEFDKK